MTSKRTFILEEAKIVGVRVISKDKTEITLEVKRANPEILGKIVNLEEHEEEAW